jgi:hypothetical protein
MKLFYFGQNRKRNMKKTFQKTLIAASVGIVMLSAAGTASANSLLFPYFTTTAGAQSVLSLTSNNTAAGATFTENIHYVYNFGTACTHFDGLGKLSSNDLLQHSIASVAAGGFGKVVSTDGSTPFFFPLNNTQGFLIVSTKTTITANIAGDMAIVDPSTGLVVSYAGISNGITNTTGASEGDFSGITDQFFNLSFYPTALVTTSWYGVVTGNENAAITAGNPWTGSATLGNQGQVFNNDEGPLSGIATKVVTCGGTVLPSDLMNPAQLAAVGPNGGLIHTQVNAFANGGTGIVMSKIQTILPAVGGVFVGKSFLHREGAPAF